MTATLPPAPVPSSDTSASSPSNPRDRRALRLFERAQHADPAQRAEIHAKIITLYLDIARSIALRYQGRGVPTDDLVQAANEGLVKAVHRFDCRAGHDFLSFAVPTMRGEVRRYFRDHAWTIRPTRSIQELQWKRTRTADVLQQRLGREPTRAEIADALDVDIDKLIEADSVQGAYTPTSLDQPVEGIDGPGMLSDILPAVDNEMSAVEARRVLEPAMRRLSDRDRRVLFMRFFEERTQKEIGREIGVSQMQVSRVLQGLLRTLRAELGALA